MTANLTNGPTQQTQPTGTTNLAGGNAASESTQRSQEIVDRVTNSLRTGFDTGGELRVHLEPPALGKVQVEVSAASDGVTARLEVQTSSAQQTLLDNISLLHTAIAQTGAPVAHIEVVVVPQSQDNSGSERQSSSGNQQQASTQGDSQGGSQNQPDGQQQNQRWTNSSAIDELDIAV